MHDAAHILLKIATPVSMDALHHASQRARSFIDGSDRNSNTSQGWGRRRSRNDWESASGAQAQWQTDPARGPPGFRGGPPFWDTLDYKGDGRPDFRWPGPHGPPGPLPWYHGNRFRGCSPPGHRRRGPPPPSVFLINTTSADGTQVAKQIKPVGVLGGPGEHSIIPQIHANTLCCLCNGYIIGVRFTCANCPTHPSIDLVGPLIVLPQQSSLN